MEPWEALQVGEPEEWRAQDAEHWADVYRELIDFGRQALLQADGCESLPLRRRLEQFERRLAFWRRAEITKP
ncbi:MAG TPA: hypothetical protein VF160_07665 [Candidatus Dormibacteraeota bacterium]